jgi:hypothetical protein
LLGGEDFPEFEQFIPSAAQKDIAIRGGFQILDWFLVAIKQSDLVPIVALPKPDQVALLPMPCRELIHILRKLQAADFSFNLLGPVLPCSQIVPGDNLGVSDPTRGGENDILLMR